MRTYTGILRNIYNSPRRFVTAYGRRFEFLNGSCAGLPEDVATNLLKRNILSEIIEEGSSVVEATPEIIQEVREEEVSPDPVVVEVAPEPEPEIESTQEEEEEEEELQGIEHDPSIETEDGVLTASDVTQLYEELGTWGAVAEHLGVSTSVLKRYREQLGL